jgi:hypothetical protein
MENMKTEDFRPDWVPSDDNVVDATFRMAFASVVAEPIRWVAAEST